MSSQDFLDMEEHWNPDSPGIIPAALHIIQSIKALELHSAENLRVTPSTLNLAESLLVTPPTSNPYQSDLRLVLLTDRQRKMVWYYETHGVAGLCYAIYEIALTFIKQDAKKRGPKGPGSTAHAASHGLRQSDTSGLAEDDYLVDSDATNADGALTGSIDITNSYGETRYQSLSSHMDAETDSRSDHDEVGDSGHKSWRDVRDDFEKGTESRMFYGLASLPPDLIPAILYGDLPVRMQDKNFFDRVGAWLDCGDEPGVYGAFVAVSTTTQSRYPQIEHPIASSIGAGPCLDHILKAIDAMRVYINLEDPASSEISKKIDGQYDPVPRVGEYNYKRQRKYAGGAEHRSFSLLEQGIDWLHQLYHEIEQQLRSTNDLHLMTEPMRSPVYIGMSCNPSSRALKHKSRPDSKLMGLFRSALKYLYGDLYEIGSFTYQLFHSGREDDIGFLEIIASILSSGYPWDGGLAHTYAGGRPHGMHEIHKLRMNKATKMVQTSGNLEHNVQDSAKKIHHMERRLHSRLNVSHNSQVGNDTNQLIQIKADDWTTEMENLEEIERSAELEEMFAEYAS